MLYTSRCQDSLTCPPVLPPGVAGRGAWQNWRYEVEVTDLATASSRIFDKGTFRLRVPSLTSSHMYRFRVRAVSTSGHGPWSQPFTGETLKEGVWGCVLLLPWFHTWGGGGVGGTPLNLSTLILYVPGFSSTLWDISPSLDISLSTHRDISLHP